jgi:hypothetical protein
MTWNDFRHKDEWADYRLDTPAGGDPLQPLEDKELAMSRWDSHLDSEPCQRCGADLHTKWCNPLRWIPRRLSLWWKGRKRVLPVAVLAPKKKFRWWFSPKKALGGVKRDHFDHDYDDRHHFPDPNCDCIPCSCTCIFCVRVRGTKTLEKP